jgi:mannitol 2-dehydrogenase
MPDTPQRIATDTSQKISVRFGETIKRYMENDKLDSATLTYIPLAIAGWLRYLLGVDDKGNDFELSPDPLRDELREIFTNIKLGEELEDIKAIQRLLSNEKIFGVNLADAGLDDKVIKYFRELIAGPGAVRKTLEKYL